MKGIYLIPILVSVLLIGTIGMQEVWAPTKIAPTDGAEPGHPFTIIDTPEGRLADGTVCLFTLDGTTTEVPLKTHPKGKTAQGTVPDVSGGNYDVSCRLPDGTTFAVGTFEVDAPTAEPTEPSIEPTQGAAGTSFTITDPQGRLCSALVIVFFEQGLSPDLGAEADDIQSVDCFTMTGIVLGAATGGPNFVTVHEVQREDPPIFAALEFIVV